MLIVKLEGGLGNQMFQYAVASILAKKNNTAVLIDDTFFDQKEKKEGFTPRDFELLIFNNNYSFATKSNILSFYRLLFIEKIKNKLGLRNKKVYQEKEFGFDKKILSLTSSIYLSGYFQSYKYFSGYESYIKKAFSFPEEKLDTLNREILVKIRNTNSVSIHVRRGDYVNDLVTQSFHGNCSISYYSEAISKISHKIDNITLFFFSDDLEWVKMHFKEVKYPKIFVDHNIKSDSWKDMFLMSSCNHNIIANSSFSWWAAWLNNNSNKIIISPKKWFNDEQKKTTDLIPEEWIRL
ncbi:alpha-1,2-fucosyltransferase [Flavobacterium johnsoniae]|uniref:alpha-1,2-fucosyltransferase n=1 Tax=Flavobacterium johnsoniae TaxID=986 RepID=UPI0025AEED7B|nr:alpha-1,2-fucosyltransferase [Flavobacterium johnsoniae]WJS95138.1 alpha-1,2-fucosyltransferase [Flavobacterium johnsoniae]